MSIRIAKNSVSLDIINIFTRIKMGIKIVKTDNKSAPKTDFKVVLMVA